MPIFLDTNILLYQIGDNPADEPKRTRAEALLGRRDVVISVQVLNEFYVQATRRSRASPLTHDAALSLIETWLRFRVIQNTTELSLAALKIKVACNLSYWDCAILAAARAGGCETLYTEDLPHGRIVDGVAIVDPFR